jgi:hypothetical protein
VVGVALDQVAHLLRREPRAVHPAHVPAVQHALGERLGRRARRAVGVVEVQHRARDVGLRARELAQRALAERVVVEEGVGEQLAQVALEPRLVAAAERAQVHLEALREPDEERRRERPPVVLEQVEVARRDAEAARRARPG